MTGILDSVNQRTQLVGQNRLELLTFRLNGRQRYGINVFKVKEVLQCPSFDSAKVAAIKDAIANGSYVVDPEKLADSMIKFENELGGHA